MKLTIDINDELMTKAKQLSDVKTKKAIVDKALRLYVSIESQIKLKESHGK